MSFINYDKKLFLNFFKNNLIDIYNYDNGVHQDIRRGVRNPVDETFHYHEHLLQKLS